MTKNTIKMLKLYSRTGEDFEKYIMNRRLAFRTDDEHSQVIKDTWTNKKAANYMNVLFKGN